MKEFPPYRLDTVNQVLWRSKEEGAAEQIFLAPKAFDVLSYLTANPGRLITHDELLDTLWPNIHVQPEVIKGQILTLRHALGDEARAPRFIETLRGRGYRFVAAVRNDADTPARLPPQGRPNLVGRTKPLDELRDCGRKALAGRSQLVFVVGEPGIGKTALIEEFTAETAANQNIFIARGQCAEGFGGTEPYYPVLEALGRLCRSPTGDIVTQNIFSFAPTWAMQLPAHIPLDRRALLQRDIAGAGRERMLREICEFFDALSLVQPLLLILEDLHWADYSTIDLLSAIGRRRSHTRIMVVASYRSEDAGPTSRPVKQVSHALGLHKLCREIVLEPLSEESVAEFLAAGDGTTSVPAGFASMIRNRSGGNPLFMTATLDHLAQRGLVDHADHRWQTLASFDEADLGVPLTLGQVIEARIQHLTEEQRRVLQAASVAGVSFAPESAACAADTSPESFEDVCEDLCRQQDFIRREGTHHAASPQTYSFRHAIYRQVFYERQGPLRRARAHRGIAERLEALCPVERRPEIAADLAQHFTAAEEWARALTYLRIVLQTAKQRFANREALEILDRSTTLAQRLPAADRPGAELALLEARAAVFMFGHDPRAMEIYEQLATMAGKYSKIDIQIRALLGLAYAVGWHDQARAFKVLDQAIEIGDRQPDWQLQARTQVSGYAWKIWIGGWDEPDARKCEAAFSQIRDASDPVASAWAALEFGAVALVATRYREAQEIATAAYQELRQSAAARPEFVLERAVWSYYLGMPMAYFLLGELGNALLAFNDGIDLFSKTGNRYAVSVLRLYRAWLGLYCFDYDDVLVECGRITQDHEEWQQDGGNSLPPAEYRLSLLLTGLAKIGLGATQEAFDLLSEVARRMDAQPVILDWYLRMPLERGLVNVSIAAGRPVQAKMHADRLIKLSSQTEERTWRGYAWETRARVALYEGDLNHAARCIEEAREVTSGFTTPLADWQIHATAAAVYEASGNHHAAGHHAAASAEKKAALADSLPEGSHLRAGLKSDRFMP